MGKRKKAGRPMFGAKVLAKAGSVARNVAHGDTRLTYLALIVSEVMSLLLAVETAVLNA